jgi:hypothetical protein
MLGVLSIGFTKVALFSCYNSLFLQFSCELYLLIKKMELGWSECFSVTASSDYTRRDEMRYGVKFEKKL